MTQTYYHLDPTEPEWDAAWRYLFNLSGDYADKNLTTSDCWQYMGTFFVDGQWQHQFRHRDRARSSPGLLNTGRVNLNLLATEGWIPESVPAGWQSVEA